MKLLYTRYGVELELMENQMQTLVLENPLIFSSFLQNLMGQVDGKEGELILSEGDKIYPLAKTVVFLPNPLMVDCNEKKIITKLYKELADHVKSEMCERYSEIHSKVLNFLEEIINTVPYHLEMNIDPDVTALLKTYEVRVATEDTAPLERLIDYLRAVSSICGIRIFILLNLKQFYSTDQLRQLYEFCFYEKIHLINLEGQKNYVMEGERYVIIDKDMCLIES